MGEPQDTREKLEAAIAAIEAQRPLLGGAVDAAIEGLRGQLAALDAVDIEREDQRKQITIVFADVRGFTHMSQTMDPEDVAATMNQLWSKIDQTVVDHGGRIDKHIGDAVMALFGAPIAKEDDAERAVLAALEMQRITRSQSGLDMRIGINTGLAMLGRVGSNNEYTAIGHTVNLASRLEGKAPPGEVLISHDTFTHVRGVFDVVEVELLKVRGIDEPVRAYQVKKAKPRTFRVATREVAGIETKTIGRDEEMAQLVAVLPESPDETSEVRLVTLVGEPGVGKSRLLYEYFNHLEAQPHPVWLFRGRAVEATRQQAHTVIHPAVSTS